MTYIGASALTLVRTTDKRSVYVYAGQPVPDTADLDDVERLVNEGYLRDADLEEIGTVQVGVPDQSPPAPPDDPAPPAKSGRASSKAQA